LWIQEPGQTGIDAKTKDLASPIRGACPGDSSYCFLSRSVIHFYSAYCEAYFDMSACQSFALLVAQACDYGVVVIRLAVSV
jgi:hypothetical protein